MKLLLPFPARLPPPLPAAALVLETVPARLPGNWPPVLSPSVASDPLMEPGRSTGLPPCLVRASETPTHSTKEYTVQGHDKFT